MKNKTDLIVRIASLLLIATGIATLYFSLSEKGKPFDETAMESLRGHGSLNVVVTIAAIIMCGILITLWRIDRKVTKLENELNEKR